MAKRKVEKENKEEKVEKVRRTDLGLESILDLNSNNVWNMREEQIAAFGSRNETRKVSLRQRKNF
jgi:hypothetical protein